MARIVLVQVAMPVTEMTETGTLGLRGFFAELRRLGWVEGQNLVIERRSGEGWTARYPELAREVVGLRPDVIVAGSTRLVRALDGATTTVPVVAVSAGGRLAPAVGLGEHEVGRGGPRDRTAPAARAG